MADRLSTESRKLEKVEQEFEILKTELQIVKIEKEDLKGRLKITLSKLEVKQAVLNKMNTDSKFLRG